MKRKEVEDVLGEDGLGGDKADGECREIPFVDDMGSGDSLGFEA